MAYPAIPGRAAHYLPSRQQPRQLPPLLATEPREVLQRPRVAAPPSRRACAVRAAATRHRRLMTVMITTLPAGPGLRARRIMRAARPPALTLPGDTSDDDPFSSAEEEEEEQEEEEEEEGREEEEEEQEEEQERLHFPRRRSTLINPSHIQRLQMTILTG